jgi:hypothetical protein
MTQTWDSAVDHAAAENVLELFRSVEEGAPVAPPREAWKCEGATSGAGAGSGGSGAGLVEAEWRRLPAEAQEQAASPDELLAQ